MVVGSHDFVLATRREERVIGGALVASGSAAWITAYLLVHHRRGWAVRALTTVSALGGVILVSIQASFQSSYRNWIWWALAVLPFVALLFAERALAVGGGHTGAADPSRESNKTEVAAAVVAASATIAGALLGLMGGAFRPVASPNSTDVDVPGPRLADRAATAGQQVALVDTAVTMENIGRERLVYFGSAYIVQGYRSESRPAPDQTQWPLDDEVSTSGWSGRYERPVVVEAVEVGYDLVNPGDYLEPGQTVTFNWVTPVSTEEFNTVESWVLVSTGYEQRLRLGQQRQSARDQRITSDEGVTASWDVTPTSWVAHLTRGHQSLEVSYALTRNRTSGTTTATAELIDGIGVSYRIGPGGPADTGSSQRSPSVYSERIANFYGTATTVGSAASILDAE